MPDLPEPQSSDDEASRHDGPEDRRRQALIASLRQRFTLAEGSGDAAAKQALFQEAAYLNLPPALWQRTAG